MKTEEYQISSELRRKLSSARGQRFFLRFVNLVLALLALGLILAGFMMLIDWMFAFRSTFLRFMMSLSACAGFLIAGYWIWRRLPVRVGLRNTANWLDNVNPSLEERLSTVVELEGKGSHSPEMLSAVGDQIDRIEIKDNVRRVVLARPFFAAIMAALFAMVLLGSVKLMSGSRFSLLVDRLVHPFSEQTLTQLPGKAIPQFHVRGRPFKVSTPVAGRVPDKAMLEYRTADGSIEQRRIEIESGRIESSISRMEKDFAYRVIAGDDETPWNEVTVVDHPRLEDLKLVVTPPAYTNTKEQEWTVMPRRIEALEGSKFALAFAVDQNLSLARIIQGRNKKDLNSDLQADEKGTYHFHASVADSIQLAIELTSAVAELQSRFAITIAVKRDKKPKVRLLEGTETFAMKADEVLDIDFRATDDYGIESAELVAEIRQSDGSKEEFRFAIDLGSQAGERDLQAGTTLDLKQLPLKQGSKLNFSVEVRDERGLRGRNSAEVLAKTDLPSPDRAHLEDALEAARELEQQLQAAKDSNDQALAAIQDEANAPADPAPPRQPGDAPQDQDGELSSRVAKQSKETHDLLDEASRLASAAEPTEGSQQENVSKHIEQAKAAVAAAQAGNATKESLTTAKEEINRAMAAAEELARATEERLRQAEAQAQQAGSQGAFEAELKKSLQSARALADEARQILQAGGNQKDGQTQQGQQGQQGGQNQQQAVPEGMLDQLEEKIKEAAEIAKKLSADEERESIQESIQSAEESAMQARQQGVTEERLEKIQKELGKALQKLGEKADIEKRKLDLAKAEQNKAKSGSAQVTVDEFAEYHIAGDGAKKQQIAIQEVLDLILECAQTGRAVIAKIGTPPDAGGEDRGDEKYTALLVEKSPIMISVLKKGAEGAEELRQRSEGTPYSFFGLQAKAMIETGFEPALEAVGRALQSVDPVGKAKNLQLADERLRWVISLLEKNKAQFEKMIAYEEVLQLAHQFKKMHKITIEDMPPGECESRAGPYPKLKQELSDQDVQAMIAQMKLKREVLKRLSELLQDNPELRARYLAQSEASGKIYREELSRLRNKQLVLAEGAGLLFSEAEGVEAPYRAALTPKSWSGLLRRRLLKFTGQTTEALGIARIWIPTETPPEERKEFEDSLAMLSQAVAGLSEADPLKAEEFGNAVVAVRKSGKDIVSILDNPWWKENYDEFSRFRFDDLKSMSDELDACVALAQSLRRKEGHPFLSQLQDELNDETRAVTLGMMGSLSGISGVSPKADEAIEALDKVLTERLYPTQKSVLDFLARADGKPAMEAMETATSLLEEATLLLDSAIVEFLRTKSEQDALAQKPEAEGEAQPLPDPSEDQIEAALAAMLRKLEEESRKSSLTKLGIGVEQNVQIENDWEKDPKDQKKAKSEREALERQRKQQMKSAQQAANAAGKAQQAANSRARALAKQMTAKAIVPWKERDIIEFEGRNDWNTLPGELRTSLTQDFDTTVPEEFRSAIDEYFRMIAETNQSK